MIVKKLFLLVVAIVALGCCGIQTVEAQDAVTVRIARLRIKSNELQAFTEAVKEEMEAALRLEPGVVAIYAVADKNDPAKLTFFEIYVNEEAYDIHRKTPHFIKYYETTKDMVAERELIEAVPVELRDKRNTLSSFDDGAHSVR